MKRILATALFVLGASAAAAQSDTTAAPNQLKVRLMQETLLIAVTNFTGPASAFVEDDDANTLQIVFLAKPEQGESHVSQDGEVVFLAPDASQDIQQALIAQAFDIRVQRRIETGQLSQ